MDLKKVDVLLDWALPDDLMDEAEAKRLHKIKRKNLSKRRRQRAQVAEAEAQKRYAEYLFHSRDGGKVRDIIKDLHAKVQLSVRGLLGCMLRIGPGGGAERRSIADRYWRAQGKLDVLESLLALLERWELADRFEGARFGSLGPSTTLDESGSGGSADHGEGTGSGAE